MVGEITTGFRIKVIDNFSKPIRKALSAVDKLSKSSGLFTKTMKKEIVASRTLAEEMAKSSSFKKGEELLREYIKKGDAMFMTTEKQTSSFSRLLQFLPKLSSGFIYLGIAAAGAGIKLNANKAVLDGVVSSSKEADEIFSRLKRFGETTLVPLSQIVKADAALIQFTGSQKKSEAITKKLATISGAYDLKLDSLAETYMRVSTRQRFGMVELRSLGAAYAPVIAAMKKMALQNGWTSKSFTDALTAGRVSSNSFVAALNIVSSKGGAAYKMMQAKNATLGVQLKELGAISINYLDDLLRMVTGFSTFGGALQSVNKLLRSIEPSFERVTKAIHKLLVAVFTWKGIKTTFEHRIKALVPDRIKSHFRENVRLTKEAMASKPSVDLKKIGSDIKSHFRENVRLTKEAWAEKRAKHHIQITIHDPKGHVKNVSTTSDSKHADFSLGTNMSTALEL